MGLKSNNPRYNVKSCRISDDLDKQLTGALRGRTVNAFLAEAITEKIRREENAVCPARCQ